MVKQTRMYRQSLTNMEIYQDDPKNQNFLSILLLQFIKIKNIFNSDNHILPLIVTQS